MSKNYNKVKNYFDKGLWNIERVRNAVIKEWITSEEFENITGLNYSEQEVSQ